jgi:putative selenium metabolism protein SsnA
VVRTVLAGATLAGLNPRSVTRADIGVEDGRIAWIGDGPTDGWTTIDCSGCVVMPGNVCAHTHLYSALARGMPPPPRSPRNFPEILELVWWRLDRALDEEGVRYSALSGAIDALKAGTTTLVDHHASPESIDGSLDVLADAIGEVGARSVVCYEVTDRGGEVRSRAGLRENERFLRDNKRELARGMVGAHASFTLEDGTLEQLAALAGSTGAGVHIHVAEDVHDETDSLARSGKRTAQRLLDAGVLDAASIAAHGVHLQPHEVQLLHATRTWLVHNCRSNLNNSVGRAPVSQFGERSALGTDGIDGDMFAESRTAYFRAREDSLDAFAEQFTDRLAAGGELVSERFGFPVGTLEPGGAADLMVLECHPPTPLTADNLAWHWMFAFSSALVRDVMVAGNWVVRGRECVCIDEEKVRAEARSAAERIWKRMEDL